MPDEPDGPPRPLRLPASRSDPDALRSMHWIARGWWRSHRSCRRRGHRRKVRLSPISALGEVPLARQRMQQPLRQARIGVPQYARTFPGRATPRQLGVKEVHGENRRRGSGPSICSTLARSVRIGPRTSGAGARSRRRRSGLAGHHRAVGDAHHQGRIVPRPPIGGSINRRE